MQENKDKNRHLAKERTRAERKKAGRREKGSALLVCEGKCTEPFYLQGLLQYLDVSTANVEIIEGQSRSNAVAVINRARQRFDTAPRESGVRADRHRASRPDSSLEAMQEAAATREQEKGLPLIHIEPILSTPCFEVWLLLHFRLLATNLSHALLMCCPSCKPAFPDYQKSDPAIFLKVGGGEGLGRALMNTTQLRSALAQTNSRSTCDRYGQACCCPSCY
jgi:hypothetical protein